MDPGTIALSAAIISSIAAIGGTGMSMVGSIKSGQQQEAAYKAQAEGARFNQGVAEQNAQATEKAAAYSEELARKKAVRLAGTQTMGYAKAGVLPEGSPLDVMAETAALEEQDILATRYNYGVQAARYRSQAGFYGFEAERQDSMSGYPMQAAYLKAGTSLLTTGVGLAKTWGGGGSTYNPANPGSGWGGF